MKRASTVVLCSLLAIVGVGRVALSAEYDRASKDQRRGAAGLTGTSSLGDSAVTPVANVAGGLCIQPAGNCQSPNIASALTSDRGQFFKIIEDITPSADGAVSRLCWRGAYYNFATLQSCPLPSTDAFEIAYYEDLDGLPGDMLAAFSQTRGDLAITGPSPTGQLVAGQTLEYEYTAMHTPVALTGGSCYWIEITNRVSDCSWLWETSLEGNGRSLQDSDGIDGLEGYDQCDLSEIDMNLCLNLPLGQSGTCVPPPPSNNVCDTPEEIVGEGTFSFNNFTATTTGLGHDACLAAGETQLAHDVWFNWTADCTGAALAWTCHQTCVDTKIAVYDGCSACPPTDGDLLACNDDRCGEDLDPRESMVAFQATHGQSYLLRVGSYPGEPGGVGSITIACGPPDRADCPGEGSCCEDTASPGCSNETCCETVCLCDSFCCEVTWDVDCAAGGFLGSGCGAELLCVDGCATCGKRSAGDCCSANGSPGCCNTTCCETVCAADPFCCDVEWDENCATHGFDGSGNGALDLCADLCGQPSCPDGSVVFVDPPPRSIDAGQPHPPADPSDLQGARAFRIIAPCGGGELACWSLTESATYEADNEIISVQDDGTGTFVVTLLRSITPAAVTTITYTSDSGASRRANFTWHPGNVNGDELVDTDDVRTMLNCCLKGECAPAANPAETLYRCDVDRSGRVTSADLLRIIDLMNGGDAFDSWMDTSRPAVDECP